MSDLLSNTQYPITCPSCKNTFNKRFRELETKDKIICPRCRTVFPVDRSGFASAPKHRDKAPHKMRNTSTNVKLKL